MGDNEMKNVAMLMLTLFIFCSCTKNVYRCVNKYMKNIEEGDSAILKMSEIFTAKWDTMYVLGPGAKRKFKYQKGQDIERRIIFVKNGIVIHEEREIAIENPYKVGFLFDGSIGYFTPETAIFSAKKLFNRRTKRFYFLTPIETGDY